VQVTVVMPMANELPEAREQLTGCGPSTASLAVTTKLTGAVPPAGAVAAAGGVSSVSRGPVSTTRIVMRAVLLFRKMSVAVQLRRVSPIANVEPGAVARSGFPVVTSTGTGSAGPQVTRRSPFTTRAPTGTPTFGARFHSMPWTGPFTRQKRFAETRLAAPSRLTRP
jgi:hypothetical protein